jgi:creatinine amidohydrolase
MTQPEAEGFLAQRLPFSDGGSREHGPHLPCGTDYLASLVIGQKVAERVDALLVPFCPHRRNPFHMSFAGTLTLQPQTFIAVVEDICQSGAARRKRVVFLNWHEGTPLR